MGIPSYFSYIIKNHANIVIPRSRVKNKFSSLYLDCNSIIYDALKTNEPGKDFEKTLIKKVILKIQSYIDTIKPDNVVYIAFDGVAPLAKMEQQRTRRYKTGYLASIHEDQGQEQWSTSAITPGTAFMNLLSKSVQKEFTVGISGVKTVIISASDQPGEGEHKMFQYMRDHALQNETIAVYGLDSDLIMLSLFHCFACENIYICREAPAFGNVLSPEFSSPDELIYLDHRVFTDALYAEMMPGSLRSRIYDYIFMCFLLGNDFLPHFPSLNIRTHGITTLLDIYSELCSKDSSMKFISMETGNIQWGYVKVFLIELAKLENASFIHEYESRHKFEKRYFPTETKEERMIAFDNIPVLYRDKEHYIRPGYPGWESRYYHVAFPENTNKKSICINYLEGLEWVFRYYTEGCPHWRWKYHYHYPPLFQDLIQYCPSNETFLIDEHCGTNTPLKPSTQLLYVIPKWNHSKLLSKKAQALTDKYSSFYIENPSELKFEWMFCRYFWEAHTLLPEISIPILEKIDKSF